METKKKPKNSDRQGNQKGEKKAFQIEFMEKEG